MRKKTFEDTIKMINLNYYNLHCITIDTINNYITIK
jgi:hypothetical protein